jgi:hypothetical protein
LKRQIGKIAKTCRSSILSSYVQLSRPLPTQGTGRILAILRSIISSAACLHPTQQRGLFVLACKARCIGSHLAVFCQAGVAKRCLGCRVRGGYDRQPRGRAGRACTSFLSSSRLVDRVRCGWLEQPMSARCPVPSFSAASRTTPVHRWRLMQLRRRPHLRRWEPRALSCFQSSLGFWGFLDLGHHHFLRMKLVTARPGLKRRGKLTVRGGGKQPLDVP